MTVHPSAALKESRHDARAATTSHQRSAPAGRNKRVHRHRARLSRPQRTEAVPGGQSAALLTADAWDGSRTARLDDARGVTSLEVSASAVADPAPAPPLPAAAPIDAASPTVVVLNAELGERDAEALRDELYAAVRQSGWVLVEARDVAVVSAAVVGVLIAAALLAHQLGGGIILEQPSEALRAALRRFSGIRGLFHHQRPGPDLLRQLPGPALPTGWVLDAASRPSSRLGGGDVVVCRHGGDGRLHLLVADVAGRGATVARPAAALRRVAQRLLDGRQPELTLPRLNDYLQRQSSLEQFATAAHIAVDLSTGAYEAWSAGHPAPAVWHGADRQWEIVPAAGRLLGIFDDLDLQPAAGRIPNDGTLLLYTDGAVERRGRGIDSGLRWLLAEAAADMGDATGRLARQLVQKIAAGTVDDVTVAVLHRDG